MLAEERHPMPATSRRAFLLTAIAVPALGAMPVSRRGASAADFERAIAEANRLVDLGSTASRAVSASGGDPHVADAASDVYWSRANALTDWVLETPPTCAKGAAIKLRLGLKMVAHLEDSSTVELECMRSVLAWLEAL